MTHSALYTELMTDPLTLGYASLVATRDDVALAALINTENGTKVISRFCNERTILSNYADGPIAADALLTTLENYAAETQPLSSIVRRALRYVQQPDGLDLGAVATIEMLGALAQYGVITADQLSKLTAIATIPSSRALDLFGSYISVEQITGALNEV
jgi:hypothetical protein